MAWMQNMYKKFEAMCLELDDILEQVFLSFTQSISLKCTHDCFYYLRSTDIFLFVFDWIFTDCISD
jgi:hypothetical protein